MSDQEKAKTDLIYKKFQLKMLGEEEWKEVFL